MKISYYDKKTERTLHLDLDSGISADMPATLPEKDIDGLPVQKFAVSEDGKFDFLAAFRYTLRDDMERKIRRRFFRRNNETGEVEEMFTKWDRSSFQPNGYTFLKKDLFFTIASFTETGENGAYFVDISENLDGSNAKELWRTKGYPYGWHLSPDKKTLAFHQAGGTHDEFNPYGYYAINLMDMNGQRKLVCSEKGHLFFGPTWSPDGNWLVFQDCFPETDPAHHFADVTVCKPDGSGFRRLTVGRTHYFGTSFGLDGYRMGGSNCPIWTNDSKIIYSPLLPDSHPDCHFDKTQRSHEELIYDPSMGKGGCGLSRIDPETGNTEVITPAVEGCWDFRPRLSSDNKWLLYTHSEFGKAGEIRLLNMETKEIQIITNGTDGKGADHASFLSE